MRSHPEFREFKNKTRNFTYRFFVLNGFIKKLPLAIRDLGAGVDYIPRSSLFDRTLNKQKQSESHSNRGIHHQWTREWTSFKERALTWVSQKKKDGTYMSKAVDVAGSLTIGLFCYILRGKFEHQQDGESWKPSQGWKKAGRTMAKRYYYSRKNPGHSRYISAVQMDGETWTFLEYHCAKTKRISLHDIRTPDDFDWAAVIRGADSAAVKDECQENREEDEVRAFDWLMVKAETGIEQKFIEVILYK
ncbi:hypothetical protein PROFUN_03378 [Planoprotostelium fungivorum]|uniref:Uncharacterized protein n=1 Tax=Planoprotostelium fungivorum TaxID=1890364 RepID=A0A2P6NWD8_9EUKA|nr:hypothetical protein PROFUN_03378 [Planoprotostelium fungivorum]